MVSIQARFKKDERPNDGLTPYTRQLLEQPHQRHLVIGIVRPVRVVDNLEDGTRTPVVRFDQIELIPDDTDEAVGAHRVLSTLFEKRTGNPMPPATLFDPYDEAEGDGQEYGDDDPTLFDGPQQPDEV